MHERYNNLWLASYFGVIYAALRNTWTSDLMDLYTWFDGFLGILINE